MNLSCLIHTFNGYRHVWPGCFSAWKGLSLPIPAYFGTDVETDHDFQQFTPLFSGPGSWSDRLVRLLHKIPTDYVLYMQEDHWPTKPPPDLSEMMKIVSEHSILRLQLSPVNRYYTIYGESLPLFFENTSKYLVSHQPSIWRKDFFLDQIRYNEDPWKNEYEGTKRLNNDPSITGKIAIYPCNWHHHACVRGSLIKS